MQGKVARAAAALCAGTMLLTGYGGTENAQQTAGKAGGANGSSASVHAGGATHPFAGGCGIPSHLRRAAAGSALPSRNGVAFPLGAWYLACLKVNGYSAHAKRQVKQQLAALEPALREGCAGQLPEIYDGEPPTASRGCFAQAWSVSELLRVYEALERPGWNTERNERETYMEQRLQSILNKHYGKNLDTATDQEVYTALMLYTKEQLAAMPRTEGKRKLYYVSAEFLIGKLLSNNLINLGLFDEAKELDRKSVV